MAKKRRKLNKEFEKKIYSSKKNVELVLAKIFDDMRIYRKNTLAHLMELFSYMIN